MSSSANSEAVSAWAKLPWTSRWRFVTAYDYLTPDGRTAFAHIRWASKHQSGIDPERNREKCFTYWVMGPHPVPCDCDRHHEWRKGKHVMERHLDAEWRHLIYRLPDIASNGGVGGAQRGPLFIAEGEKDVHALEAIGCLATTAHGGAAHGWLEPECAWLTKVGWAGEVVLVVDDDEAGWIHGMNALASLTSAGVGVSRVVQAKAGKDPHDAIVEHKLGTDWWLPVDREQVTLLGQAALEKQRRASGGRAGFSINGYKLQQEIDKGDW